MNSKIPRSKFQILLKFLPFFKIMFFCFFFPQDAIHDLTVHLAITSLSHLQTLTILKPFLVLHNLDTWKSTGQ